ncbi:phosphatidylinositol-3-phosphatase SAC1 [Choristoneura fumiferana]|uniref:phosphatidylinositol-3-phosphatase SAC1 n=1 Tax=Choristoneura fumiferana TaxID=7141 RepID=UPI003D15CC93
MADLLLIHDDIKLYTTSDKFYLEPTINPSEILVIDRVSGSASVKDYGSVKIPIPESAYKPVCGFLGSIKLISGLYLVVAKYRILIGKLNGHDVYQLAGADIIPYARSTTHLTNKQIEDNTTYEKMVRAALDTPGMYFSYGYDITHTQQRLHSIGGDFHAMSIASRADNRFLWNGHLLRDYSHSQFARFALPLIQGFVAINRVTVNDQQLTWAVVSRRSVERAGTRLFMRGVDPEGQVANYVETEQIIERGGEKSSFVQTRGSIPLFWSQYPNIKYKPACTLAHEDHVTAYTKHLRDQQQRYGSQVLVNLIDQCGKEEALERGFRAAVAAAALPGVRYEPFDFHAECRGMRYDRLTVLVDRIAHEQTEFGYFLSRGGSVLLRQSGVFRTNCVDCLDRTNVVQSLLARRQLAAALRLLAVTPPEDTAELDALFNEVWADHADMISVQYSGTGALKTDFTRTGKRTRLGLLRDGYNSITRYFKNNFSDGFRQDSIDLFLGKYVIVEGEGNTALCPLRRDRGWKYIAFPSVLLVAMSMFCATAALPARYTSDVLFCLMFWGACVGATLAYIVKNGKDFVDWPRLDAGGLAALRAQPQL